MNDLAELHRRKAVLKSRIEQQRTELKATIAEIRKEMEPLNLLKKAVGRALGFPKNGEGKGQANLPENLSESIIFVANLFIKNPKWAFAVKLLAPTLLKILPKMASKSESNPGQNPETESGQSVYSGLRRQISALRSRLRKAEKEAKNPPGELVEPSEN